MSLKLPAASVKLNSWPCRPVWPAIGCASTGASLMLPTVRMKSPDALAPAKSVAVRRTDTLPTSALAGVPVKVRLAASKLSQAGKVAPLTRRAW